MKGLNQCAKVIYIHAWQLFRTTDSSLEKAHCDSAIAAMHANHLLVACAYILGTIHCIYSDNSRLQVLGWGSTYLGGGGGKFDAF